MYSEEIEKSISYLKEGKVILYPTDTVWGVGCDATNFTAVEKIYKIKRRTESKSLIILVDSFEMLKKYVKHVPDFTEDLLNSITNPVTIIYSNAMRLAKNVIAPDHTVGIRIVKDDFCKPLISKFGKPIVSTSANISGDPTPIVYSQISEELKNNIDFIVNCKRDLFVSIKPSTIIRLQDDGSYTIIRT